MRIRYRDQWVSLQDGETLLDGLLRDGFDMAYGCRAGVCHSCLLQARDPATIPAEAQTGLTEQQRALGYFLACSCHPRTEMDIVASEDITGKTEATVLAMEPLNRRVLRVRLRAQLEYRAGQYINVWRDNQSRSYSLASVANAQQTLELHIKLMANGYFSRWLHAHLHIGDPLFISGPVGNCFYLPAPHAPLLLAGMGTGLAPLYGVLQDALLQGHRGEINLYAAARHSEDRYLFDELRALEAEHAHLSVHFVALHKTGDQPFVQQQDLYSLIKRRHPDTSGYRIFICGAESFVRKLKKQVYLTGASLKNIHSDSFLPFVALN